MSQTLIDVSLIKDRQVATVIDATAQILSNAGVASNGAVSGTTINNSVIGGTTPAAGTFTTLTTTGIPLLTGRTSGTAIAAGYIGEVYGGTLLGTGTTATVTITIAAPGVITWTTHGFSTVIPQPVVFTTSSSLPTGITSGTVYYTIPSTITASTFSIATTVANALLGTAITTSGSQAGTQTGTAGCALSNNTVADVTGAAFTAGDWMIFAEVAWDFASTTTWTKCEVSMNTTSATLPTAATTPFNGASYASISQISAAATNGVNTMYVGPMVLNVSSATNVYLSAKVGFGTSTAGARGKIVGRRMS